MSRLLAAGFPGRHGCGLMPISSISASSSPLRVPGSHPIRARAGPVSGATLAMGGLAAPNLQTLLEDVDRLRSAVDTLRSRVQLTHQEAHPDDAPVVLRSDDLGLSLSEATSQSLDSVLPPASSGAVSINGTELEIDLSVDTISSVVGKINAAGVGVRARYNAETGAVSLTSLGELDPIELEEGTTGLFAALGIDEGRHEVPSANDATDGSQITSDHMVDVDAVEQALADVQEKVNELFARTSSGSDAALAAPIRAGLQSALAALSAASGHDLAGLLGVGFSFPDATDQVVVQRGASVQDFLQERREEIQESGIALDAVDFGQEADVGTGVMQFDASVFDVAAQQQPGRVADLLLGSDGNPGLAGALEDALRSAEEEVRSQPGGFAPPGLLIDAFA